MNIYDWLVVIGAVASLSIIFLKKWLEKHIEHSVKSEYEKELETHKANLQRDYFIQIERLKAELVKNQYRFSSVFQKTLETMEQSYSHPLNIRSWVNIYQSELVPSNLVIAYEELIKAMKTFAGYYYPRRLYVPLRVANQVEIFVKGADAFIEAIKVSAKLDKLSEKETEELVLTVKKLDKELSLIFASMEKEVQILLGLHEDEK